MKAWIHRAPWFERARAWLRAHLGGRRIVAIQLRGRREVASVEAIVVGGASPGVWFVLVAEPSDRIVLSNRLAPHEMTSSTAPGADLAAFDPLVRDGWQVTNSETKGES